jgi:hypothetical protein
VSLIGAGLPLSLLTSARLTLVHTTPLSASCQMLRGPTAVRCRLGRATWTNG